MKLTLEIAAFWIAGNFALGFRIWWVSRKDQFIFDAGQHPHVESAVIVPRSIPRFVGAVTAINSAGVQ